MHARSAYVVLMPGILSLPHCAIKYPMYIFCGYPTQLFIVFDSSRECRMACCLFSSPGRWVRLKNRDLSMAAIAKWEFEAEFPVTSPMSQLLFSFSSVILSCIFVNFSGGTSCVLDNKHGNFFHSQPITLLPVEVPK